MKLFKKQEKSSEITSERLAKQMQIFEARLEKTQQELDTCKLQLKRAVTKVGMKRFNPFREIGGDQSFSVALLDQENNGFVVTSYYGKDLNRVFAKPLEGGVSQYELAEEEKEAIAQAIGLEKPKFNPPAGGKSSK